MWALQVPCGLPADAPAYILIDVLMGHCHDVLAQAWPKIYVVSCQPSCQDPKHDTTFACVSRRHGPKFFVSCGILDRAKMLHFV
jgi:hypothetical protein